MSATKMWCSKFRYFVICIVALSSYLASRDAQADDPYCKAALEQIREVHAWLGVRPMPPNTPMYMKIDQIAQETQGLSKAVAELPGKARRAVYLVAPDKEHLVECRYWRERGNNNALTDCVGITNPQLTNEQKAKALISEFCRVRLKFADGEALSYEIFSLEYSRNVGIKTAVCMD